MIPASQLMLPRDLLRAWALGVLAYYFKIDFNEALELIISKVWYEVQYAIFYPLIFQLYADC